jgi:hypothetical protein
MGDVNLTRMMINLTECLIQIVLYKDRFDVYVTNIGDMFRLILHKIREDFIQPGCQEFDMRRCMVHLPNSSPKKCTIAIRRGPYAWKKYDGVLEEQAQAEVRFDDLRPAQHALELVQNSPVVADPGEQLGRVLAVGGRFVHIVAPLGPDGLKRRSIL